ncbi:hypothetical protein A0128_10995 [Leptospira tipperaryensis]|uniref:Uncharacterized protein n=1 Tax=Leptospira tipperaryensis TaxID=2564040 RepID=A0A1D7UXL4_9LEPT|nr:hypothetical protein A0128_10995 [Leptospira tipperaryensis]
MEETAKAKRNPILISQKLKSKESVFVLNWSLRFPASESESGLLNGPYRINQAGNEKMDCPLLSDFL